jgi:twitching motility two-component system response regulator PilH
VVFALAKILVIDDSSFQRKIISGVLTENGYQVTLATNGKEGIEHAGREQPDIIITDLLMPEYDGHWVLEHLHAQKSTIPVIILTSDIQTTTEKQCRELGVAAFLNKPVDKKQLISTVQNTLKRS